MKINIIALVALFFAAAIFTQVTAQVQPVKLNQAPGAFTTESVDLAEGQYQFEIGNEGVDHEVGFVLVPKGKYDPTNHIKEAYVSAPVPNGQTSKTKVVTLAPGNYEYFCPLNPTEKYPLTVHKKVKAVKLTQVPGQFKKKALKLKEGAYQFEIINKGVEHNVGFVVVPKGKYDAANHIKAAYVSAPVAEGSSSKTSVVNLTAGTYEYFCPLNPTPKYTLIVK